MSQIQKLLLDNADLRAELAACYSEQNPQRPPVVHSQFLQSLIDSAQSNENRQKNTGNRYGNNLKQFCAYLFTVSGRFGYDVFHGNLVNIVPSTSHVASFIGDKSKKMTEACFRWSELRNYLISKNLPLVVWISEDGTRITFRIQYDPSSNQIVGFVLPFDSNGVPKPNSYPATSASKIMSYFENGTKAANVYTIMAQPAHDKSAAFCLGLFGTDNKFTSSHVVKRWKWMQKEALKEGILILGFSSDGDAKLLKAMRTFTFSKDYCEDVPLRILGWFRAVWDLDSGPYCFQDFVHIATKLRSLFLQHKLLPMGWYLISCTHIEILMKTVSKEDHGLTETDVSAEDKMNFQAALNLSNPRVTNLLISSGNEIWGTVAFLETLHNLTKSFMDTSLSARDRLRLLWRSLFLLRIWRQWLQEEGFSLEDNFITYNQYMCIEINAHVMVKLIRKCKEMGKPELFLPWLFSSQACESFVRLARSMSTTYSTVVNFSLLDFLHKIRRIDFQRETETKLSKEGYSFPRDRRKKELGSKTESCVSDTDLPTDIEIMDEICVAYSEAKGLAQLLGMEVNKLKIPCLSSDILPEGGEIPFDCIPGDPIDFLKDIHQDIQNLDDDVDLDLTQENDGELPEDSPFVLVKDSKNRSIRMKKTTLCWLLSTGGPKLSSDRLKRVKASLFPPKSRSGAAERGNDFVLVEKVITRGSWCAFVNVNQHSPVLIGHVMEFSYLSGTLAERKYTLPSAPVTPPTEKAKGLGCLCVWYNCSHDGILTIANNVHHSFHDINKYICTIPSPVVREGRYFVDKSVLQAIERELNAM